LKELEQEVTGKLAAKVANIISKTQEFIRDHESSL
jgi:hypothetical protein